MTMTASIIILLLFVVFDFAISIWNAYASGYNIGMLRRESRKGFFKISSYSGLGLAFVGMGYVIIIILSLLAYYLGYASFATVEFAMSFNFLVFGLMIIGFGLIITVQSIIIAAQKKDFWSIAIAIYNTFAEIWDIASYASGFKESVQLLRRNRQGSGNALIIIVIALFIAFFIVHAAYRHGYNKATAAQPLR